MGPKALTDFSNCDMQGMKADKQADTRRNREPGKPVGAMTTRC